MRHRTLTSLAPLSDALTSITKSSTMSNSLEKLANQSGFPLQIAVQKIVDSSNEHDWKTIFTEHSWINPRTNDSGFIDLVLEWGGEIAVLIVECKRVIDTSWLFFNSNGDSAPRRVAKVWHSELDLSQNSLGFSQFNWRDVAADPQSPECEFSIVWGEGGKSKPMLEREASTLVLATEAFAHEEIPRFASRNIDRRVYFNVIITTARLHVGTFDPARISIKDGTLTESSFIEVPYLRFRKQLTNGQDLSSAIATGRYREVSRAKENTIFVVNADHLTEFLAKFEPDGFIVQGI